MEPITCRRCAATVPPMDRPPFRSVLGERIRTSICPDCWKDWLKHQTLLINHHGLDPRQREAREFLYGEIERVLLGGETGTAIDQEKQGSVRW